MSINDIESSGHRATGQMLKKSRYRLVALCFLAVFVCYLDRVNISVAALAMQENLQWSETTKGLVLSSFFVGYLLFQVPSGYLANRFGGKRVLGFAVLWWSFFTVITPWAAAISLPMLLAVRFGMGLGEGAMFPAAYNLFAHSVPKEERSRSVSILVSGIPVGTLFALFVSGILIARYGWPAVFYAFGALGFVWGLIWFTRPREVVLEAGLPSGREPIEGAYRGSGDPAASRMVRTPIPWGEILGKPAVWALMLNHFCGNWTMYMLLAWLPSYFSKTQGLGITSSGLYSAAPWLTMFIVINCAAWLADVLIRRGVTVTAVRKTMQTIGLLGSAAFLLSAPQAATPATALALMCGALGALGFIWAGYSPNYLDISSRYADILMGIGNTVATIPGVVGVAITGWLVETSGTYASAFVLAAAINVVGTIIWLAFATGNRILD